MLIIIIALGILLAVFLLYTIELWLPWILGVGAIFLSIIIGLAGLLIIGAVILLLINVPDLAIILLVIGLGFILIFLGVKLQDFIGQKKINKKNYLENKPKTKFDFIIQNKLNEINEKQKVENEKQKVEKEKISTKEEKGKEEKRIEEQIEKKIQDKIRNEVYQIGNKITAEVNNIISEKKFENFVLLTHGSYNYQNSTLTITIDDRLQNIVFTITIPHNQENFSLIEKKLYSMQTKTYTFDKNISAAELSEQLLEIFSNFYISQRNRYEKSE